MSHIAPGTTATLPPPTPSAPQGQPTRFRYAVLGAACLLAILTYLQRAGFQSITTELLRELRMDSEHLGYLTAAFMIAYGLFEIPWGLAGDRRGSRNLLVLIALGGSAFTASVALVSFLPKIFVLGLWTTIALRFLFGAFQAGTFPVLSRALTDWMPSTERGSAQGLLWMSTRFGGFLAPLVMTSLYRASGDWRVPLLFGAGLGGLWCVGFWPWFRNRPEEMPRVNAAERSLIAAGRTSRAPAAHGDVPWGRVLRSSNVRTLCLMYACLAYSGNFFLFQLTNYLEVTRHLDKDATTWLTALPFGFGVFACVGGGFLSDLIIRRTGSRRWGRSAVGATGLLIGAIGAASTLTTTNVYLLGVLLCLTFIGNDLAMGPSWAAAADIGERYAGSIGGAMNMMGSFAGAVAALITGRLLKSGYPAVPFLLFSAAYVIGSLCWLRIDASRPLVAETDDQA